jgi:hypothetical protein
MSKTKQKQPIEVKQEAFENINEESTISPFQKYSRNEYGLLNSVNYHFNDDGSINWRKMIKNEFLYPNKGWFDLRKKETPNSIEGLADNQLLIMLGGIKELAKLRGFTDVTYQTSHIKEDYIVAKCQITWIGNYETNDKSILFEDVANATIKNTDDFCIKFLETIACNRAFVRCVRNFLNIHIVGADEIDRSKTALPSINQENDYDSSIIPITPSNILEKIVREKHSVTSFDEFKNLLRDLWSSETYRNESAKDWFKFEDIPAKEARSLLSILSKK